jgi:signal transduction histidine kinase
VRPRRLAARWRSLPPRTIRLRLTAVYGGLFLACGAALLAINYGLVSGQISPSYFLRVDTKLSGQITEKVSALFASGTISGSSGGTTRISHVGATGPTVLSGGTLPPGFKPPKASRALLIASAHTQSTHALATLLIESGVALAIMALLAVALGWIVAGRALRPLRAIIAAAQEISASNLHRRLALAGPDDELRRLGNTFDALLERLESAFAAQRQFAANVSHELRTPLTYERALIEVVLADPDTGPERLRSVLEQVLAAGVHQERLIEALLVLSRGQRGIEARERIDLADAAAQVLAAADPAGLRVERSLATALTEGDPRLIERLAANLVANAVQHNVPGGRVEVVTRTDRGRAILAVANSGAAISADDLDRLFEPFERLDGSRTSGSDGLGLGLSIVRAIADAHGATITTDLPTGGGLRIEVAFPSAAGSPA